MLLIPKFASVNDHAFLADDTLIGCYELGGGWIRVEHVKIGKRAFVGNSGMAAAGPQGAQGLAGRRALRGPAARSRPRPGRPGSAARRPGCAGPSGEADDSRTYDPPRRLRIYRGLVETGRVVPMLLAVLLGVAVGVVLLALLRPAAAGRRPARRAR